MTHQCGMCMLAAGDFTRPGGVCTCCVACHACAMYRGREDQGAEPSVGNAKIHTLSTHNAGVQRYVLLHVQEGREIKVLAEELAALESKFRSVNPMGGTRLLGDWTVRIDGGPGRWAPAPACCWRRSACLAQLSWARQEHSCLCDVGGGAHT